MKASVYFLIDKFGNVRVTKTKPAVQPTEVITKLNFDIPDSLFVVPIHEANIKVNAPTGKIPSLDIEVDAIKDWITSK